MSFPFSEDYLRYCINIRQLLKDLIDFTSDYYSQDLAELNRIIVNDIFEKCLGDTPGFGICHDMKTFITKNANNKEIVAQSYTNLEYYLYSLYEIGKLIDKRLRFSNGIGIINIDTNSTFKLKAIELFTSVRKFSEDAIFQMVDQKVHELLELLQYEDWTLLLQTLVQVEISKSLQCFWITCSTLSSPTCHPRSVRWGFSGVLTSFLNTSCPS